MPTKRAPRQTSWDTVADWYTDWVGEDGGRHHREQTIPAALHLLAPRPDEQILDVGAGPGVLATHIARAGAYYTGIDASPRLLDYARLHHGHHGRFLCADACTLDQSPVLRAGTFDAAVFLLSIQDMDPLCDVLRCMAWALRGGGRVVIVMTHPCFRVPRLSGWGWDEARQSQYRRVDRYLSPLPVPMEAVGRRGGGGTVRFHRPLQDYINGLAHYGFFIDRLDEIATYKAPRKGPRSKAEGRAIDEIPVFLALRAISPVVSPRASGA